MRIVCKVNKRTYRYFFKQNDNLFFIIPHIFFKYLVGSLFKYFILFFLNKYKLRLYFRNS